MKQKEETTQRIVQKIFFWVAAACLPVVVFALSFAKCGIYPFGDCSILAEDLGFQYIDFFAWFRNVLLGKTSIDYCASQTLGSGMWGLYSYYLASPFNLLVVFFDQTHLCDFVVLITALKVAAINCSMTFYLKQRFQISSVAALLLAMGFTCCVWVATNMRNIMWLDALIFLPLASCGVYLFLHQKRWKLLVISLASLVITCWYMAYMCIIFLVLLVFFELGLMIVREPGISMSTAGKNIGLLIVILLFSFVLSAWIFLPTLVCMGGNVGDTISWGDRGIFSRIVGIKALVRALFLGGWVYDGAPQVFGSTLFIVCAVVFFVSKKFSGREKLIVTLMLFVLLASTDFYLAEYVWCGFRLASGFYCRYAFFFVFMLAWVAAFVFERTRFRRLFDMVDKRFVCAGVAVFALVCVELVISSVLSFQQVYGQFSQEEQESYFEQRSQEATYLSTLGNQPYRFEKNYTRAGLAALNEGMTEGFYQISGYSSATYYASVAMLNSLGYNQEGDLSCRYVESIPVSDALLGIRYVLSNEEAYGYERLMSADQMHAEGAVVEAEAAGNSSDGAVNEGSAESEGGEATSADTEENALSVTWLQKNTNALALGYMVDESAANAKLSAANPFERQNELLSAFMGKEVRCFEPISVEVVQDGADGSSWQVIANTDDPCYVFLDTEAQVQMSVNGEEAKLEGSRFQDSVSYLGQNASSYEVSAQYIDALSVSEQSKEEVVNQVGDSDTPQTQSGIKLYAYRLNTELFASCISALAQHQMQFTTFEDGHIVGTVTVEDGRQSLMISIPHQDGWSVWVDGEKTETQGAFDSALTIIPLSEGTHVVEMRYETPGRLVGILISLPALAVLVLLCVPRVSRGLRERLTGKSGKDTGLCYHREDEKGK